MTNYEIKYEGPTGKLRVETVEAEQFHSEQKELAMWKNEGDTDPVFILSGFPYTMSVIEQE